MGWGEERQLTAHEKKLERDVTTLSGALRHSAERLHDLAEDQSEHGRYASFEQCSNYMCAEASFALHEVGT